MRRVLGSPCRAPKRADAASIAATSVAILVAILVLPLGASAQSAATASRKVIVQDTPAPVAQGTASEQGEHNDAATLDVNIGLGLHDASGLDELIAHASTPGDPQYGHYLTNAQYKARYAPTGAEVDAASAWLESEGLHVVDVTADNLLIHVRTTVQQAERVFAVSINDYSTPTREFHANDRNPSVPTGLNISWVSGLSNFNLYKPAITCTPNPGSKCGYDGNDFRSAYNVTGDGKGRTIGFTLWGRHLPQSDFDGFAAATSSPKIVVGQAGDDGLDWIDVDGASTISNTDNEVALDLQIAHHVAPGSHLTYWLGKDNSDTTLEHVLNAAANSSLDVISNSWGCDGCSIDGNMDTALQHGAATGKTFYFSTGDNGASVGRSRPVISPNVVAVGGTNLTTDGSGNWSSENAWSGSGGGCDNAETRPSWQTGIGSPLNWPNNACSGRAIPDVSADGGIGTYLYYDGGPTCCTAGTSLSTPIWAALATIWNNHNLATGRPTLGFAGPLIYQLANNATTYANDFHDITSGSNGFSAGTGWDEATGWGTPNFNNLSNNKADITYTGPTSTSKGSTITLSGTLFDKGATTALTGKTISFAAAGSSCDAVVDGAGNASCNVTINDNPGHYSVIAAFGGDVAYVAASVTKDFTVNAIPTAVAYIGPTTGTYNHPVTLRAKLTDTSNGAGLDNEPVKIAFGAESCTGTTGGGGVATCTVTPHDLPAGSPYTITVSFAGDLPTYLASSNSSSTFTVTKAATKVVYNGPSDSDYHDAFTASGTLVDPDGGAPLSGKTVTFKLGASASDSCSAPTNGAGAASCQITPTQVPGNTSIVASFAGDDFYLPSTDTKPFRINREQTTLSYDGPAQVANDFPATLKATLLEDGTTPPVPAGQTVTFTLGSGASAQTCQGTVDAAGHAQCTIASVNQPDSASFTLPVSASFGGDAYYLPSGATSVARLLYYTGRSFGASLSLLNGPPSFLADTGAITTSHKSQTDRAVLTTLLPLVTTRSLAASVTTGVGSSTGRASASDVTVGLPLLPVLHATGVTASSTSTCAAATGATQITTLTIGGIIRVVVNPAPNSVISVGGLRVVLNEQTPVAGADHGMIVNALHISAPGVADVVIASAKSDIHNCP